MPLVLAGGRAMLGPSHREDAAVFASLALILRILLAWAVAIIVAGFVWSGIFSGMDDGPGWVFGLLAMFLADRKSTRLNSSHWE